MTQQLACLAWGNDSSKAMYFRDERVEGNLLVSWQCRNTGCLIAHDGKSGFTIAYLPCVILVFL